MGPAFRLWPPLAIALPWLLGWLLGHDGTPRPRAGWLLIAAFVVWNGWCLVLFARHRTGLLPGQGTSALIESGPYRVSRNPLYLGLLLLYAGAALVVGSVPALLLLPVAWAGLHWGAVLPEERYLAAHVGEPYRRYRRRVRRWV